jgi:hypothetical protein
MSSGHRRNLLINQFVVRDLVPQIVGVPVPEFLKGQKGQGVNFPTPVDKPKVQ